MAEGQQPKSVGQAGQWGLWVEMRTGAGKRAKRKKGAAGRTDEERHEQARSVWRLPTADLRGARGA